MLHQHLLGQQYTSASGKSNCSVIAVHDMLYIVTAVLTSAAALVNAEAMPETSLLAEASAMAAPAP